MFHKDNESTGYLIWPISFYDNILDNAHISVCRKHGMY